MVKDKEDKKKKQEIKEDNKMQENKIMIFIIGLLVGAIIASIGFIIYNKVTEKNKPNIEMNGQNFPMHERNNSMNGQMPNGMPPQDENGNEIPNKRDNKKKNQGESRTNSKKKVEEKNN